MTSWLMHPSDACPMPINRSLSSVAQSVARSLINVLAASNSNEILKCASHLMCCRRANHLCSAFGQDVAHMHAISQLHACTDLLHFLSCTWIWLVLLHFYACHAGSLAFISIQFLKAYLYCLHVLVGNNLNVLLYETLKMGSKCSTVIFSMQDVKAPLKERLCIQWWH